MDNPVQLFVYRLYSAAHTVIITVFICIFTSLRYLLFNRNDLSKKKTPNLKCSSNFKALPLVLLHDAEQ